MNIITRFAPSPTGLLHVGNIRTALIDWLFTRKNGGKFILRIDDTDLERSTQEFEHQIKEDLKWLGMSWDETFNQKDRTDRYQEITNDLISRGTLYPCYETKEELEFKRKIQLSQGKPPIYDRSALSLSKEQISQYENEGRTPHYRFKLSNKNISWHDLVRGNVSFDGQIASDPILIREDGSWTYMLCSAIDDIDCNVTHVIRGEDHISNTVVNIEIFHVLGKTPPIFAHVSRVTSKTAEMSKRAGGFDIKSLREQGIEPMALLNFLSTIGTSKPVTKFTHIDEVIRNFDIESLSKSPSVYDETELWNLNHKILSQLTFSEIRSRVQQELDEHFWLAIRNNIQRLPEVDIWFNICRKPVTPIMNDNDRDFLAQTATLLDDHHTFDETSWDKWLRSIKSNTTRKGKELFLPIRLALTGLPHGPELQFILPLITKEKAIKRLMGETI